MSGSAVDDLFYLFMGVVLFAATSSGISVWAPIGLRTKLIAFASAVALIPFGYAAFGTLLSRPKPVSLEWVRASATEAVVLGATSREGEGIYLWLVLPDVAEPRSYVLPWSRPLAEQLQEAKREAEKRGTGLAMKMPFENSLDDREPKFYPMPQPAMPPKDQPERPTIFEHPSRDA